MSDALIDKFHALPQAIQQRANDAKTVETIKQLEQSYGIKLARLVIRLLVGEVSVAALQNTFVAQGVAVEQAETLSTEINRQIISAIVPQVLPQQPSKKTEPVHDPKKMPVKIVPPVLPLVTPKKGTMVPQGKPRHKAQAETSITELSAELKNGKPLERITSEHNLPAVTPKQSTLVPQANPVHKAQAELSINKLSTEIKNEDHIETALKNLNQPGDLYDAKIDALEIQAHADLIETLPPKIPDAQLEVSVEVVMVGSKINFSSQLLSDRYRQILTSYIRGIREKIDTREALAKPIEAGGLDLVQSEINQILALAEPELPQNKFGKSGAPKKIMLPEDKAEYDRAAVLKAIGGRDVDYDLTKAIAERQKNQPVEEILAAPVAPSPSIPLAPTIHGTVPTVDTQPPIKTEPVVSAFVSAAPIPFKPPVPSVAPKPLGKLILDPANKITPPPSESEIEEKPAHHSHLFWRRQPEINNKKRMDDITVVPKSLTPIDELRFMDLVGFRRVAPTSEEAILKIKQKIAILEKERYSKKIEAVQAWRLSPVNRLYQQLNNLAIAQKQPISEIIEEKTSKKEETLSQSEFESIMKLNQDLRF